jgi:hypothetical protein
VDRLPGEAYLPERSPALNATCLLRWPLTACKAAQAACARTTCTGCTARATLPHTVQVLGVWSSAQAGKQPCAWHNHVPSLT